MSHAQAESSTSPKILWLGYLVLVLLLTAPLLITSVPPLLDYPNHLARAHILATLDADPLLQQFYAISYKPIPNLASDLFIPAAAQIFDIYTAGRLFLALCLITTILGVACLHRVLHGAWHWWPMVGGVFAFHGAFMAGFINFSLGIGLAFLCAAAWIAMAKRPVAIRIAAGSACALLLFFTHMFAICLYGLIIASHLMMATLDNPRETRWRRETLVPWLVLAAQFLVPAILVLGAERHGGQLLGPWSLGTRTRGLFMPVLNHDLILDGVTVFAVIIAARMLQKLDCIRVARSLVPALIVSFVLFLLLPSEVLDTAYVAERFPIIAVLLFVAACNLTIGANRTAKIAVAGLAALFVVRQGVLAHTWMDFDGYMKEMRTVVRMIKPGSVVDAAISYRSLERTRKHDGASFPRWSFSLVSYPNLIHMTSVATIDRSAFVPLLFTHPDKQPLSVKPNVEALDRLQGIPLDLSETVETSGPGKPTLAKRLRGVHYLIVLYAKAWKKAALVDVPGVAAIYRGKRILLFRLPKDRRVLGQYD